MAEVASPGSEDMYRRHEATPAALVDVKRDDYKVDPFLDQQLLHMHMNIYKQLTSLAPSKAVRNIGDGWKREREKEKKEKRGN